MQVEAPVLGEPRRDVVVFVGGVVVEDQVNLEAFGHRAVDRAQELQELVVAVAWQAVRVWVAPGWGCCEACVDAPVRDSVSG